MPNPFSKDIPITVDDWEDIEGRFGCYECGANLSEAQYSDLAEQVKYTCSKGHKTVVNVKL